MTALPQVSMVLVAHRSSALLPEAVGAFRREAATCGVAGEAIVVEHSDDAAEATLAAASGADRVLVRPNRGYAAGINAGLETARGAVVLVSNPDAALEPGSLAALLAALDGGCEVVGPQFSLAGARFPPAEAQTPRAEAARRRAWRSRAAWERHLGRELARWRAVWEADAPRLVPTLSGALLAFPAAPARRIGPWDEGYFLYFEETDWLRRASRQGARLAVVPAARASHRWGHSAPPQAWAARFERSRERYYRLHFPALGPWLLRLPAAVPPAAPPWTAMQGDPAAWRWLLSPAAEGFPAAALPEGRDPALSAAAFADATGRRQLWLVGWRDGSRLLAGPYRWSASDAASGEGGPAAAAAAVPAAQRT